MAPIDRDYIKSGMFMKGGAHPAFTKYARLPADLQEFESTCREADRLAASGLDEIRKRLEQARKAIHELREAARRR